ncbi:uncharacterized protein [Triticum aestivum]|uniref:uncharacterized protein n=1 Tax=Triticum aestivum TaxID=4565 RepID=UPI001D0085DC|nr:uncharacterized protein LOC123058475 [Triticum aestivum]
MEPWREQTPPPTKSTTNLTGDRRRMSLTSFSTTSSSPGTMGKVKPKLFLFFFLKLSRMNSARSTSTLPYVNKRHQDHALLIVETEALEQEVGESQQDPIANDASVGTQGDPQLFRGRE